MKTKLEKIMGVIVGLGFVYLGASLLVSPFQKRVVTGYIIDTSGYNKPLGVMTIFLGVVFIYVTVKAKLKKQ